MFCYAHANHAYQNIQAVRQCYYHTNECKDVNPSPPTGILWRLLPIVFFIFARTHQERIVVQVECWISFNCFVVTIVAGSLLRGRSGVPARRCL
ncbi:uncharacterized protein LACBIDRAFT_307370 [Laccaria bicolor S238N-H82]|uniref:Predicted protein n=1 Tax=Laccaria bicolor (strain S238N-H82 / ATCC MYA-4686) TaxID=486041 RepID=B0DPZ2_LACBS|nr:uncharacterized protein LACBIDRAFT_307370 [Laccaria bicolor S238N-H82]EDR03201.1 predicted protein [Laccaria bicolor S238N-H82]|eukprot:XP_001885997.1 predicted protein [Laccaria bicolor S238N-H82]